MEVGKVMLASCSSPESERRWEERVYVCEGTVVHGFIIPRLAADDLHITR